MGKLRLAIAVSAVVASIGLGAAATGQPPSKEVEAGKRWLKLMNHTGDTDDTISKEEFDRYVNREFDKADTDHDGTLTAEELGHLRAALLAK